MPRDENFDGLAEEFSRCIYGSGKGELRERILWQQLVEAAPEVTGARPLRVLDAGAGLGHMSARLATAGHRVLCNDVSGDMLSRARQYHAAQCAEANLDYSHAPLQSLCEEFPGYFDLVVCHAVLEWLAEPLAAVDKLLVMLRPGGVLSLAFYNRDAMVLNQLQRGNLANLTTDRKHPARKRRGFTPPNPLYPREVLSWFKEQPVRIRASCGVRVIYDWLPAEQRETADLSQLLAAEARYSARHPFKYIGRYFHIVAETSGQPG